ncbi:minor capsid protein [Escherichia coli]|nr:minor capsid protein [Escherichia coli]
MKVINIRDNGFDTAIARADETIRGHMGTSAHPLHPVSSPGAVIRGVFDDPENISYAGQGVRVEGSSPSLFVRTDDVRQLRRGDTLTIGEENFWIDRVSPDDGGSCHLWLGRGVPPAVNRRR